MIIAFYILVGILALVVILGLIAPKKYNVFRTVEIKKTKTEVFEYLKYLDKQQEWSPWAKKDPNMERKLTGVDGEVGAVNYWLGNKEVGEGEQEITKIVEGERIEGQLRFLKPWKSTSDCYFKTETISDNVTQVLRVSLVKINFR